MKKVRVFLLALILTFSSIAVIAVHAAAAEEVCPNCGRKVEEWIAIVSDSQAVDDAGHYYMNGDYTLGSIRVEAGDTTCLDLRGKKLTANRNIIVESGATVYIAEGDMVARGHKTITVGGMVNVMQGGTLIMNDVDVTYQIYDERDTVTGGIFAIAGNATLNDCTITGGRATQLGGNFYVSSTGVLTLNGGSVTGGMIVDDTAHTARCIYSEGKVILSGDASVDLLRIGGDAALEISGPYTGKAALYFDRELTPEDVVATIIDSGNISGGSVSVVNTELELYAEGNTLALREPPAAVVNGVRYDNLNDAINAAGEHPLELRRSLDEVTIDKKVTIDLAGCNINKLTVVDGVVVSVMDSKTDDYDIGDGVYGKIKSHSGVVEGKVLNQDEHYFVCTENDDEISFHKLRMVITHVSLRSSVVGLYYSSDFKGDQMVKDQVQTFGVELSLEQDDLNDQSMKAGRYTAISKAKFNEGVTSTSTVLTNVMRADASTITNRRNAATNVYGRPYIRFADGSMLQGAIKHMSLQKFVEEISDEAKLRDLNWEQQDALVSMCHKFYNAVKYWRIEALELFRQKVEADTLRILTIGNSHSNDSNWQLQNVFAKQKPNQKVTVGILYYSGCAVSEHVNFAENNLAKYQYYKNTTGTWIGEDTPLDTMQQALEDVQWDIVLLQETNVRAGQEAAFQNDNIQFLMDYVKKYTRVDPQIGWNMVWANPVVSAYLAEDTRMTHAMEDGKSLNGWIESYKKNFNMDQQYMFQCMLENINDYILTNKGFDGNYIMPSGTAVQYANNVLGLTDTDLYRDYTHLSEMSRLMVSYLWYCKLTGETLDSIDDIKVDVMPKALRHSRFAGEGDLIITDEMKQVILDAVNYALENPFAQVDLPETPVDPAKDTTLDVLMIGNSFCHYFPDELKAMADQAGKQLRVCNAYYSGCTLKQHYQFLKNGEQVYAFRENGQLIEEDVSLWYCLKQDNWDVISFQEGSSTVRGAKVNVKGTYDTNVRYFAYLHDAVRERFPLTQLVFHQTWAYQVGTTSTDFTTADTAAQTAHHNRIVEYTKLFLERYSDLDLVNSGDAWALIRDNSYDNLCARLGKKVGDAPADSGDNYHDGDIGGGQFLNACVWYEYLFDLDVRENTFVPTYDRPGSNTTTGTLNKNGNGAFQLKDGISAETLREAAHAAFADPAARK